MIIFLFFFVLLLGQFSFFLFFSFFFLYFFLLLLFSLLSCFLPFVYLFFVFCMLLLVFVCFFLFVCFSFVLCFVVLYLFLGFLCFFLLFSLFQVIFRSVLKLRDKKLGVIDIISQSVFPNKTNIINDFFSLILWRLLLLQLLLPYFFLPCLFVSLFICLAGLIFVYNYGVVVSFCLALETMSITLLGKMVALKRAVINWRHSSLGCGVLCYCLRSFADCVLG